MNIQVRTLAIQPCGCGFEGSIRFQLEDTGIEVSCGYVAMNDKTITEDYKIGTVIEAPIFLAFGCIKKTVIREYLISPTLVGRFAGWKTIDDECYAIIEGPVKILVDNELGDSDLKLGLGDWVECTGELMLGHKNEEG